LAGRNRLDNLVDGFRLIVPRLLAGWVFVIRFQHQGLFGVLDASMDFISLPKNIRRREVA
jgi:hypothetical protein